MERREAAQASSWEDAPASLLLKGFEPRHHSSLVLGRPVQAQLTNTSISGYPRKCHHKNVLVILWGC